MFQYLSRVCMTIHSEMTMADGSTLRVALKGMHPARPLQFRRYIHIVYTIVPRVDVKV